MVTPLRLLMLEDNPADAELVRHALRRAGYDPIGDCVETEQGFRDRLQPAPEVILADFTMPEFDSLRALEIMQGCGLDIPFIIVSGTIGEERAVQAMQLGASDYIMKDRLGRLGQAVAHALEKKQLRDEKQRTSDLLRQSNQTLHALIQTTPLAIITLDQRSQVTMWNSAAEKMFGWQEAEVLGRPLPIVPADQQEAFERSIHYEFRPDQATAHELRLCHRTGSLVHVSLWTAPVTDASNSIIGALGLFVNITESKRLEEQSRRAETERDQLLQRLQVQIERMPLAYLLIGPSGIVLDWNPAAERIFGYARQEALGKSVFDLVVPAASRKHVESIVQRLLAGDMSAHSANQNRSKDGRIIACEWYNTPLLTPEGAVDSIFSMALDVSDRVQLEEQYRQSQKMEAVGRLAAGVAHDFNNLLTIILGYSELLLGKLPAADPDRQAMGQIHKAAERASGLTRQLLAFGRKQLLAPVVLDLNSLMTELDKMLRRLIGEDIELRIVLQPALGPVKADPGQIEQIVMNLAINSRDAMPTGGLLTIQTGNADLTELQVRQHPELPPGPYTLLAVSDTGHGMDDATKARLFEPFFTTKEVGKGTGLGLATVFGIIKQSGGFIEVDSSPGVGTTFRTYLPQTRESAPRNGFAHRKVEMPKGTETILLVEDEAPLRKLARIVLETNGYKVIERGNGLDAIEACQKHADPIHLLLTDVVMPKMSGRQLAESLAPSRPGMKVLYMSGYTDDTIVRHGIGEAAVNFLPKPFNAIALAQKVREVLDATNGHQGAAVAGGFPPAVGPVCAT